MARNTRARAPVAGDPANGATLYADTNIFIRYLTGSPEDQFERVQRLFDQGTALILTNVVTAEIVYVLQSLFSRDWKRIADAIRTIVAEPHIHCEDESIVLHAADLFEELHLDWADCFLMAYASTSKVARVLSFDRGIDKVDGIRLRP